MARDADVDGEPVALGLDALVPGDHRGRLEAELGDDVQGGAGPLRERVLPRQRLANPGVRDVGAALGVSRDSDSPDSVLVEQPGFEELHGAGELAQRLVERAADQQGLIDVGLAGEARETLGEKRAARHAAGRDVRNRIEPFGTQPDRNPDGVREARPGEKGDEHGRPGPQVGAVVRDLRRGAGSRLGGEVRQQLDDRLPGGQSERGASDACDRLRRHDAPSMKAGIGNASPEAGRREPRRPGYESPQ